MSPRNVSRSSASWGWCLTVASNMSFVARSGGRSTGMPWLTPITSVLQATPINTIAMPRSKTLRAQNAMISAYDASSRPKPRSFQRDCGIGRNSSATWMPRPTNNAALHRQSVITSRE